MPCCIARITPTGPELIGLCCRSMTTVQDVINAADIFAASLPADEGFAPMTEAVKKNKESSSTFVTPKGSPIKGTKAFL